MSICRGCGGVLGRDCWNEADCVQISNQPHDAYLLEFFQRDLVFAEERIKYLEDFIVNNGLEIPYPKVETNNEEDWFKKSKEETVGDWLKRIA